MSMSDNALLSALFSGNTDHAANIMEKRAKRPKVTPEKRAAAQAARSNTDAEYLAWSDRKDATQRQMSQEGLAPFTGGLEQPVFWRDGQAVESGTARLDSYDAQDEHEILTRTARAFQKKGGYQLPAKFLLEAAQLFYQDGQLCEARLSGYDMEPCADAEGQALFSHWQTPKAPEVTAKNEALKVVPDAQERPQIAVLNETAREILTLEKDYYARLKTEQQVPIPKNILRFYIAWNTQGNILPTPRGTASKLPKVARQSTFIEARAVTHAISDAPTGANYRDVEGENALLHSPNKVPLQTRFQPSAELWSWWGIDPTKEAVREALKKLNFETNMTFQVTLACLLQTEHARRTFTLDEVIKVIGRDTDARRSSENRQKLRREVWGNLLTLASMPVIGARNGLWREPGAKGEKRPLMPKENLISHDPLLVITGTKGTPNSQEPPKEVSLTAGEWLMPHIGNREILSDFGDVLKLAQIPRGKVSGAWAACVGLALQQQLREETTKAEKKKVSQGKAQRSEVEVLKFRPFTRRELLTEMFRCDDENSPNTILNDPKGRRARAEEYWQVAIGELKRLGLIGHYREMQKLEEMKTNDLNTAWLDQPLDIGPSDFILKDALEIHNNALEAKKRGRRSGKRTPKAECPDDM